MEQNIKNILEDLYSVDSNLRQHEDDLIKIIKTLLAARPKAEYDQAFKQELRAQLLEKFDQIKNQKKETNLKINFNYMNKFIYAVGGLLLIMIVVLPFFYKDKANIAQLGQTNLELGLQVAKMSDEAFGSLAASAPGNAAAPEGRGAAGAGYGGGSAAGGDVSKEMSGTIIAPAYYTYVYDGEEIVLENGQLPVYKKIKGLEAGNNLAAILQNTNFGNIDMSTFQNTHLRNFQISEDKNFGYSIYMDLYEGSMSIMENWEKWPQMETYTPLSINDVPDNQTLINMANQFLAEKKISLEHYGEPYISNEWRVFYDKRSAENLDYYIPEAMTVVYPQMIDGQVVYDEWGNRYGLNVGINIRQKRVSSVYGMTSQKYQSSNYDMETDVEKILKLASQGGNSYYYMDESAQKLEIKLGTPSYSYVQIWQYDKGASNQLFVPALVFPVINTPDDADYFYRENVVIPLAKDIIDQRLNPEYPDGPVQIMR